VGESEKAGVETRECRLDVVNGSEAGVAPRASLSKMVVVSSPFVLPFVLFASSLGLGSTLTARRFQSRAS
jgi:hypothetical protein